MQPAGASAQRGGVARRVARCVVTQLALLLIGEAYLIEWVTAGFVLGVNYGCSSRAATTVRDTPEVRACRVCVRMSRL